MGAKQVFRYSDADKANPTLMNFIKFRGLNKEVAIDKATGKEFAGRMRWGHESSLGTSSWPSVPPRNVGQQWWGILQQPSTPQADLNDIVDRSWLAQRVRALKAIRDREIPPGDRR